MLTIGSSATLDTKVSSQSSSNENCGWVSVVLDGAVEMEVDAESAGVAE